MTVSIQWDADAPLTAQPNAGSANKVYTTAGAGTVTITDEAIGGASVTLNYAVPLTLTTVAASPDEVDSAGTPTERTVTVAGQGFPASTAGTVAVATGAPGALGTTVVSTGATTNASGVFTGTTLVVPVGQVAGAYHIEARFGDIGDLNEALAIVNNQLDTPTGLTSPAQGSSTVDLSWTAVAGATAYVVRWSPAGLGTWTELAPAAPTTATVAGLTPSTSYDFQVKAQAAGSSDSDWSTTLTVSTTAMTQLATPANFAINDAGVTTDTIPCSWDAVTDAETYTVSYRTTPAGAWTDVTGIATTNTNVTGLDPNVEYELRVKAVAAGFTDSDWSATDIATTDSLGTLTAPTGIASPSQTATTIDLTWTAVANATSYIVERSPAGAGVWTSAATPATNAATVSGLTASTNYDFRIRALATGWTTSANSTTFTQATTA